MLEKIFKLKKNNTSVKTEVIAGITTFMTMAYILAVNPNILSASGMDKEAILIATCIASFVGTMCMAFMANLPFALSAGLGLNAYFAYTVCGEMGYSWQIALFAVFVEGIIFIILSLTNVREAIFDAIPLNLKKAVSVGIGLFIAFIGLQNAGLVNDSESTLVTITDFTSNFHTAGICALLAVIGVFITAILYIKRVKGSILIGIVSTWVLGIICELTKIYVPDNESFFSVIPTHFVSFDFSALGETFGQCFKLDFKAVGIVNFIIVVFAFLFVDLFDTLGTIIGVSTKAGMLDENGKLLSLSIAGEQYSGKAMLDKLDEIANKAYFLQPCEEKSNCADHLWYLWSGARSPLYGKDKMAFFERYFLEDKKLHKENYNAYYHFSEKPEICGKILEMFGLDPQHGHIINGHVPVKIKNGESPVKADGRLFVIDGGISKAYQKATGIAGYTLIYDSHSLNLAEHKPFIAGESEHTPEIHMVERLDHRANISDTDKGRELLLQINDLRDLLDAYRSGDIKEGYKVF